MNEFAPTQKFLHCPRQIQQFLNDDWMAPPVHVEISPTSVCNAKCPWCFYADNDAKKGRVEIPYDTMLEALRTMSHMGVKAISWTGGGDPSMHPQIEALIYNAHQLGFRQGMFTNARKAIVEPHLLDWIRISITEDYVLPAQVAAYAQATKVGVCFNLCASNLDKLKSVVIQADRAHVAYLQIRPALAPTAAQQEVVECPRWLHEHSSRGMRIILTEYKWQDCMQPHGYPICYGHHFVPFIWHNGDVDVCAYHFGEGTFTFGNLREESFDKIWRGTMRSQMIHGGVAVVDNCQHCCKNHELNKTLAALAGNIPAPSDPFFI